MGIKFSDFLNFNIVFHFRYDLYPFPYFPSFLLFPSLICYCKNFNSSKIEISRNLSLTEENRTRKIVYISYKHLSLHFLLTMYILSTVCIYIFFLPFFTPKKFIMLRAIYRMPSFLLLWMWNFDHKYLLAVGKLLYGKFIFIIYSKNFFYAAYYWILVHSVT